MKRFANLLLKWRWFLIGACAIVLVLYEVFEVYLIASTHWIEYVLFVGFSVLVGVLIELLLRANQKQKLTLEILDLKHQLSLELAAYDDWNQLVQHLAKFPSTVAPVKESSLHLRSQISNLMERVAHWPGGQAELSLLTQDEFCQKCYPNGGVRVYFGECQAHLAEGGSEKQYCIPIEDGNNLGAFLRVRLMPGQGLSEHQKNIFKNVTYEMAAAIKLAQERSILADMQKAATALDERRTVSHFLHDNLAQNLGLLCLKLDQFLSQEENAFPDYLWRDLHNMREAAGQAYEIVRGKLEALRPEAVPVLTNLLTEHARSIAQRANFVLSFTTKGKAVPISLEIQQAIFYVFQEALNNIEKHSSAVKVEVFEYWNDGTLDIVIKDNGQGFDPALVEDSKHFGIQIMHERIAKVKGWIEFNSSATSGTVISISVPLPLTGVKEGVFV